MPLESLTLPGAEVCYHPAFLAADERAPLFDALRADVPWERHRIRMFGRLVDSPRLSCWIGDDSAAYRYSGTLFQPRPWTAELADLRARVEAACGVAFNSVLANLYRDGRDAMGWHSDDEPELGPTPVIASLSLGAERRFRLRHRSEPAVGTALALAPGSLLVMRGDTQRNYRHALPRTAQPVGERINLTFRCVRAEKGDGGGRS